MEDPFLARRPQFVASLIVAGMLLLALSRMPYGYYTFLRWCVCALGVYVAVVAHANGNRWLPLPYIGLALLFNPIAPVHLQRETWRVLDVAAAVLCFAGAWIPLYAGKGGKDATGAEPVAAAPPPEGSAPAVAEPDPDNEAPAEASSAGGDAQPDTPSPDALAVWRCEVEEGYRKGAIRPDDPTVHPAVRAYVAELQARERECAPVEPGPGNEGPHELLVNTKELMGALRQIVRFRKRPGKGEMMMLSFDGALLKFSMLDVAVSVPATGTWAGDMFAPALSIYGIAKVPPKGDEVRITTDGRRVKIGTSVLPLTWTGGR